MAAFWDGGIIFDATPAISATMPPDGSYLIFVDETGSVSTVDVSGNVQSYVPSLARPFLFLGG